MKRFSFFAVLGLLLASLMTTAQVSRSSAAHAAIGCFSVPVLT